MDALDTDSTKQLAPEIAKDRERIKERETERQTDRERQNTTEGEIHTSWCCDAWFHLQPSADIRVRGQSSQGREGQSLSDRHTFSLLHTRLQD